MIWRFVQGRRSGRSAVLLLGLCDAGKTLLFARVSGEGAGASRMEVQEFP